MFKYKKIVALFTLFLIISTMLFIIEASSYHTDNKITLFTKDSHIQEQLLIAISADHNTNTIFLTRLFYNKIIFSLNMFLVLIYRATDIPFLFSISNMSSMYDDPGRIPMLPPIELPFFVFAVIELIRTWDKVRKEYFFILPLLFFSLILCGLFIPQLYPFKFLPLITTIQIITFIGIFELFKKSSWLKKYFSQQ